mmetsp:Transcript_12920/g.24981  ORF Transcript_12920/g.24981 Transcript_12920/m.24981 type:complete len:330 (+) Transcript_12920:91-1080(+)
MGGGVFQTHPKLHLGFALANFCFALLFLVMICRKMIPVNLAGAKGSLVSGWDAQEGFRKFSQAQLPRRLVFPMYCSLSLKLGFAVFSGRAIYFLAGVCLPRVVPSLSKLVVRMLGSISYIAFFALVWLYISNCPLMTEKDENIANVNMFQTNLPSFRWLVWTTISAGWLLICFGGIAILPAATSDGNASPLFVACAVAGAFFLSINFFMGASIFLWILSKCKGNTFFVELDGCFAVYDGPIPVNVVHTVIMVALYCQFCVNTVASVFPVAFHEHFVLLQTLYLLSEMSVVVGLPCFANLTMLVLFDRPLNTQLAKLFYSRGVTLAPPAG